MSLLPLKKCLPILVGDLMTHLAISKERWQVRNWSANKRNDKWTIRSTATEITREKQEATPTIIQSIISIWEQKKTLFITRDYSSYCHGKWYYTHRRYCRKFIVTSIHHNLYHSLVFMQNLFFLEEKNKEQNDFLCCNKTVPQITGI